MKHCSVHFSSMIGGHPHIDINTTVAFLNVSPAFIGIASAVTSSLAPAKVCCRKRFRLLCAKMYDGAVV